MAIGKIYQAPSVVLNDQLQWTHLNQNDRDAFVGVGEKVELPVGFRLYKFTQYDMKPAGPATPWWSPHEPFKFDQGLQYRLQSAKNDGIDPVELTRELAAVRTNWNQLTHLIVATLRLRVKGFWGPAGWQPKFGDQTLEHMRSFDQVLTQLSKRAPQRLGLGGGAGQFFIPNMQSGVHIQRLTFTPVSQLLTGTTLV